MTTQKKELIVRVGQLDKYHGILMQTVVKGIRADIKSLEDSEQPRQEAENKRLSAEKERAEAEATRKTAESAREEQAFSDHATATSDHVQAEADYDALVSAAKNANDAATLANEKAGVANAAAGSADKAREGLTQRVNTLVENTDALLGAEDVPQFDDTKDYPAGDFVMKDGKLWKFTAAHPAGAWTGEDAMQTNLVKVVDGMVKSDYEKVEIICKAEDGTPLENVEVAVTAEGEESPRNLTTDGNGRCETNVEKGLEYTVDANPPEGYVTPGQVWHRASIPARVVELTLPDDTSSDFEHLRVELTYSDTTLGKADYIIVSYGGTDYQAALSDDNVAEYDIPIGETYTVKFQDIEGYRTPPSRTRTAKFGRTYALRFRYQAAIAGLRWMMNDGTEKDFNAVVTEDYDNLFGLIVNTGDLAVNGCGFIIQRDVLTAGGGSGNYLSANEEIPSLTMFGSHAAALKDLDGEINCEKIREYIATKATQGVTRTSSIAQTVYNRSGGVGVPVFATTVDYEVGQKVAYYNVVYEFTAPHPKGAWNADHVQEIGVGILMPDGTQQRCFIPAYGQIYAYRTVLSDVRDLVSSVFGIAAANIASGPWWTSSLSTATFGVVLLNGGFHTTYENGSFSLLPVLAY